MVDAVDRLTPWLVDIGLIAGGWLSVVMIAMIACRQPARRRSLARFGIVGALCLAPLRFGIASPPGGGWLALVPDDLARVLTVAVGLAVVLGFAWLLLGSWAARRLVASSLPPSRRLSELATAAGLGEGSGRRPVLLVSPRLSRPALVGVVRPTIILPGSWDGDEAPPADRVRLALRHELAHAETGDTIFQWLSALVQAIFPVLPPAWWIRQQLLIDQELLADDRAAHSLGSSTSNYANSLVELAAGQPVVPGRDVQQNPSSAARTEASGSRLLLRVAMLVRCPFPIERDAPRWWRLGVSGALVALVVLASRMPIGGPTTSPTIGAVPRPVSSPFRLGEVEIRPDASRLPLQLPAPLPDRFALSARVLADPATLAKVVIAGFPIVVPPEVFLASEGESWHRIELEVDGPVARLWVDDRPSTTSPEPGGPGTRLTIRPAPGRSLRIRDLRLSPIDTLRERNPDATASRGPSGSATSG